VGAEVRQRERGGGRGKGEGEGGGEGGGEALAWSPSVGCKRTVVDVDETWTGAPKHERGGQGRGG
jgi:hypothetical protein